MPRKAVVRVRISVAIDAALRSPVCSLISNSTGARQTRQLEAVRVVHRREMFAMLGQLLR